MKTFKKIVKIFFVYMILFFIFYTIHFCDENGVIEELIVNGSKVPTSNVVFYIATALIISLIMTIVLNIPIIIGLIIANIVLKKSNKEFYNKNSTDKKTDDLQYYREVLSSYSPAELNYVYSANTQFPKDAVTTLLSLKLKKIIDFNNESNTITVLQKDGNISNSEKYVLNKIKDGKLTNFEFIKFQQIVQEDVKNKNLTNKGSKKNMSAFSMLFVAIIIIFLFFIITIALPSGGILGFISVILIPLIFIVLFLGIPGIIIYSILRAYNPYKLSKEGKQLRKKLLGLKNYITQFSLLEEKELKDLIVWEDYLIYSIIFDLNDDLISKIQEKYIVFDINDSINNSEIKANQSYTINSDITSNSINQETRIRYVNSNNEEFNKAADKIIGNIIDYIKNVKKGNDK